MNEDPQPNTPPSPSENTDNDSNEPQIVSVERVLELLENGNIHDNLGRIRWSSNYTTIITIDNGELEALAVYKPQRGERPLWDFPDGTLCYREMAAFIVSNALGWELVSPTVLREGPNGLGSIQLFIEHDPNINYFSLSDDFIPELQMMCIFDVITNNTDRKGGHCLVDTQGKLWGIDHGICFHSINKLRTVIWDFAGEPVPDKLLNDLQRFLDDICNKGNTYTHLLPLLSKREIEAIENRTKQLLERKTYPFPGSGPNYPWPPV